jgi:hypoxanthine phosphoribosyltransferase
MSLPAPAVSSPVFPPSSSMDILYSKVQIAERVRQIGEQISADYAGRPADSLSC